MAYEEFLGMYQSKLTTAEEAVKVIKSGDWVVIYLFLHEKKMGKQKKGFFLLCNIVFVGAIGHLYPV